MLRLALVYWMLNIVVALETPPCPLTVQSAGIPSWYLAIHSCQCSLAISPSVGIMIAGNVYGQHYGKWQVLHRSRPCYLVC